MWSLVWGQQIAHLTTPDYQAVGASTPHPLTNLVGVLLAPLGSSAEPVLLAIGFLAVGLLACATALLANRLFGWAASVVAILLMMTRAGVATAGARAYLDVPFAALVVLAMALEAARPRRGGVVLVTLAVAGLLRPEGWVLSGLYWLYLMAGAAPARRPWHLVTLVIAPPLVWALADLLAAGDPLFSFTHTQNLATALGRDAGLHDLVSLGPRTLFDELQRGVAVAAVIGLALTIRTRSGRLLAVGIAATLIAFAIPVVAGTPLKARYLLPAIALLCVAAAAGLTSWMHVSGRMRLLHVAGAAACLVVLVSSAPNETRRLRASRSALILARQARNDARTAARGGFPCLPVAVVNDGLTPLVALWADVPSRKVDAGDSAHSARDSALWAPPAIVDKWIPAVAGAPAAQQPPGQIVRTVGGWTVSANC
jgi:hypothetical protein